MTMSWTSAATNAYTFTTNLNAVSGSTVTTSLDINAEIFAARVSGGLSTGDDSSVAINIGKTSDVDHQFSRSISVTLDDEDPGTPI